MAVLCTERGPTNETLEHDSAQAPPIAIEAVSMACEDLGRNVVWGTNSGISHQSTTSSPVIDLSTVRDSQVDLVDGNRVSISRTVALSLEKLLVVVIVVQLVESRRKAKIGQFDVTAAIQEDIVGFDITEYSQHLPRRER